MPFLAIICEFCSKDNLDSSLECAQHMRDTQIQYIETSDQNVTLLPMQNYFFPYYP